jgi:hypothetical protein
VILKNKICKFCLSVFNMFIIPVSMRLNCFDWLITNVMSEKTCKVLGYKYWQHQGELASVGKLIQTRWLAWSLGNECFLSETVQG